MSSWRTHPLAERDIVPERCEMGRRRRRSEGVPTGEILVSMGKEACIPGGRRRPFFSPCGEGRREANRQSEEKNSVCFLLLSFLCGWHV